MSTTLSNGSLGWGEGEDVPARSPVVHLVIAWSRDEPHRIGEAIPIEQVSVLGRGFQEPGESTPRAVLFRQRPSSTVPRPPLTSLRISRAQLRLAPLPGNRAVIDSIGRCRMFCNGQPATSATVGVGDVLTLQYALVFLVVVRRSVFEPLRGFSDTSFAFGTADRHGIIGESPTAWTLRDRLAIAARSPSHVLIHGPSGVGKELAAQAVHALSERKSGPFISRNAATFPEGLVDAELFGTAKGYPNAGMPERPGLIAEAEGGTLFLDEIGELPIHLQAHLLRVLDGGGEYQRLGDARPRRANIRLVAATNRPIQALKHDFAARLTTRVEIPGLESRVEDIPLLLRHLFNAAVAGRPEVRQRFSGSDSMQESELRIGPELVDALLRHPYTLHIRELARVLECSIATSAKNFLGLTPAVEAELRLAPAQQTSADLIQAAEPADESTSFTKVEIEAALDQAGGSVTKAARRLGLKNRFALYRLMKRHDIARAELDET
jgi:DNA-binding NtrC family response regulator